MVCKRRFTTYERIEDAVKLTVIKKDGSRVPFERAKIIAGAQKACYKRPISIQQLNELAEEVEEEVFRRGGQEVSSRLIGELTMAKLRRLDKVAYVRFASVYNEFQDLGQFISEVDKAMDRQEEPPEQQKLFDE